MSKIIQHLKSQIFANKSAVDDFFSQKFKENPAILYNSVDLRHSGFKIAPVDTNCFPAGFNNIKGLAKERAAKAAASFVGDTIKIMIIPENHTRNLNYLANILSLQEILKTPQNEVVIGSMIDDLQDKMEIILENGAKILLQKIVRKGNKIKTLDGFVPDLIILNNDLTSGAPEFLQNLDIAISPPTNLGWYQRLKSQHFNVYNQLCQELSQILQIDPWLISSMHSTCDEVDFKNHIGFECLAKNVDDLLKNLREKYNQYSITDQPFCYIKADSGTYGMGIMQAFSGDELLSLNKKDRNKMNMLKESRQNTSVIIQEGIATIDKINDMPAEPMIYMVNGEVVGNLFRANASRNQQNSLNAAGAVFFDLDNLQDNQLCLGCLKSNMTVIYEMIAKLAALAAAVEAKTN